MTELFLGLGFVAGFLFLAYVAYRSIDGSPTKYGPPVQRTNTTPPSTGTPSTAFDTIVKLAVLVAAIVIILAGVFGIEFKGTIR